MISLGSNERVTAPVAPVVSCKIIGVGGAGLALLEKLAGGISGAPDLVAMHTDAQALMTSSAPRKLQLGRDTAKGLGAGGDPALGQAAAKEQADEVRAECDGAPIAVVCAGLGGGTGCGAAPVVAHEARKAGALVLGVVTLPFAGEGGKRREQAAASLARLGRSCAAVVCFENDRMGEIVPPGAPATEAFQAASDTMSRAVVAILRMVGLPSLMHVGLDELVQLFRGADARCQFGHGAASGPDRADLAVEQALGSPLLDDGKMLPGSGNVLVHITGDASLRFGEMQSVLGAVARHLPESAQVFLGVSTDPRSEDSLGVTIMASTRTGGVPMPEEEDIFDDVEGIESARQEAADQSAAADAAIPAKVASKRGTKKAAAGTQEELPLDQAMRGRFKGLDPTMVDGQDLDIPTYIRMRLRLK